MAIKIAMFSTDEEVNCSKTALQFANYFAGDCKNKTAIIEAGAQNKYKEYYITRPDGIYELNNVFFVPSGTSYSEEEFDIIIKDFGKVSALFTIEETFDKVYLCEKSDPSHIFEMSDFLTSQNITCDILLFEASKEDLNAYKSYGYSCINILDTTKNICTYEVSLQLSLFLRKNGLEPPEYYKDLEYPDPVLAKDVAIEEAPKKKGFFTRKPKKEAPSDNKKKEPSKEKEPEPLTNNEDKEPEEEPFVINVAKRSSSEETSEEVSPSPHKIIKSTPYESPNYVNVPVPKPIELSREEEKTQIEVEKELEVLQKNEREFREKRKEQERLYKENLAQKELEIQRLKEEQKEEHQEQLEQQQKTHQKELIEKEREINNLKASNERAQEREIAKDEEYRREIEELKYKATHDSLTNVKNRAAFDEDLNNAKEFLLIAFDVNNLKKANDVYGHEKGDLLLTTISTEIGKIFGDENVYRMGGDEFNVLIRQNILHQKDVDARLNKLDKFLEKKTKESKDISYQVAYGYAYSSEGPVGIVIELADQRMYENKRQKKGEQQREENPVQSQTPVRNVATEAEQKPQKRLSILDKLPSFRKKSMGLTGHISIFVTSLRHSCGTSYIAGSLASAMTDLYNRDVWLDHNLGDIRPDNIMVKEISTEEERFQAFKSGIVIFDKGLYKDLSKEDKNEMLRADMNIMVSTADEVDLKNLASFIKKEGDNANRWLFVFNHVQPSQVQLIDTIMRNYSHLIIPPHDYSDVPVSVRKDWKAAINYCISSI